MSEADLDLRGKIALGALREKRVMICPTELSWGTATYLVQKGVAKWSGARRIVPKENSASESSTG